MIWALAVATWITLVAGLYLATSRDILRCIVGLALTGSAVNLLLLAAGRVGTLQPAIAAFGEAAPRDGANPLPQALVLTAIVIGFALLCFALILTLRILQRSGVDDLTALRDAEPPAPGTRAPSR